MNPSIDTLPRTALIIGATGLTGNLLLQNLANSSLYSRVYVLARRRPDKALESSKITWIIKGLDQVATEIKQLSIQDVYSCHGTTLSKAKSLQNFKKIEFSLPMTIFQGINRPERFFILSSMGANASSFIPYLRIKGQLEEAIIQIGATCTFFFRPSLLLGKRLEQRPIEILSGWALSKLLNPFKKVSPISAQRVADSMLQCAQGPLIPGVRYISNQEIHENTH